MSLNIRPLSNRVVVEPIKAENKTAGGLIIPDSAKEKSTTGKVMAVGSGRKDEPMTVAVGDTVMYGKYSGSELKVDGVEYTIMREDDIIAIL